MYNILMKSRIETDLLGQKEIPDNAYYGIHTLRAYENFCKCPYKWSKEFIGAFAYVKKACALVNNELGFLDDKIADAIISACNDIINGKFHEYIIVGPFQGGAGTSTNMNFNEVIANIALEKLNYPKGSYNIISPLNHVNKHQSTNDVFPTAFKLAVLNILDELEPAISELQDSLQKKEIEFSNITKLGRTQLMDAVPITLGMEFSAYSEAITRDRWRIFKCRERIKVVNLGGTAVGTGLGAPKKYILKVTLKLKEITGQNITRAENLIDATQNLDSIVEVSGIIRSLATNLYKISNDLRLLNSGPHGGFGEIILPYMQVGSSIMPGKVNPVIPEAVSQISLRVMSNDSMISYACSLGNLEINQFYPIIAYTMIENLLLMKNAVDMLNKRCIEGLKANEKDCRLNLNSSQALATLLIDRFGYERVTEFCVLAKKENALLYDYLIKHNIMLKEELEKLLSSRNISKLGH